MNNSDLGPSYPTDSETTTDLGDLVIMLLASTLAGLRDRLAADGYDGASELAGELTQRCDTYLGWVES